MNLYVCCRDSESTEVPDVWNIIQDSLGWRSTHHKASCLFVCFFQFSWMRHVGWFRFNIFRNGEFYVWNSFDETLLLRYLVLRTVSTSCDSFRYLTIFFGLSRYSDSLRAGRSGDRILEGARFSAPVQTGPWAHPASHTMVTGSLPG